MKHEHRPAQRLTSIVTPFLIFAISATATADKPKLAGPVIKSGTIKQSVGDEPGCVKRTVSAQLLATAEGRPPSPITLHFDLRVPSETPLGKPHAFRLTGRGTNWQVQPLRDGYGLWADGKLVDSVQSARFRQIGIVEIRLMTEVLDAKALTNGAIRLVVRDGAGKSTPTFPDVCPPAGPVPVPYPIKG